MLLLIATIVPRSFPTKTLVDFVQAARASGDDTRPCARPL